MSVDSAPAATAGEEAGSPAASPRGSVEVSLSISITATPLLRLAGLLERTRTASLPEASSPLLIIGTSLGNGSTGPDGFIAIASAWLTQMGEYQEPARRAGFG